MMVAELERTQSMTPENEHETPLAFLFIPI